MSKKFFFVLVSCLFLVSCNNAASWIEEQLENALGTTAQITKAYFAEVPVISVDINEDGHKTVTIILSEGSATVVTPVIEFIGASARYEHMNESGNFISGGQGAFGTKTVKTDKALSFSNDEERKGLKIVVCSQKGTETEYDVIVSYVSINTVHITRLPNLPFYPENVPAPPFDIDLLRDGMVVEAIYDGYVHAELSNEVGAANGYTLDGYLPTADPTQTITLKSNQDPSVTETFIIAIKNAGSRDIVEFRIYKPDIGLDVVGLIKDDEPVGATDGIPDNIYVPVPPLTNRQLKEEIVPTIKHSGSAVYLSTGKDIWDNDIWSLWNVGQAIDFSNTFRNTRKIKIVSEDLQWRIYTVKVWSPQARSGNGAQSIYYDTLKDAVIAAPTSGTSVSNPTVITLLCDIDTGDVYDGTADFFDRHVLLTAEFGKTVKIQRRSDSAPSFILSSGSLTMGYLGTIVFDGGAALGYTATKPLISVHETSQFILNNGAVLQNNKNIANNSYADPDFGGAVGVFDDSGGTGSFTMNGGEIINNRSVNGGAVYVEGTFTMNNDASIAPGNDLSNDVYLKDGTRISIGANLNSSHAALITPEFYTNDITVISATAASGKFTVTPVSGQNWIVYSGKLLDGVCTRADSGTLIPYSSIQKAIDASSGTADNPDVITLLFDVTVDSQINVGGKYVQITPVSGQDRIIKRGASLTASSVFKLANASSKLILGALSGKIIVDGASGNNISSAKPLVEMSAGDLVLKRGATLQNNDSSGEGGAVSGSGASSKIFLEGALIKDNKAVKGGGIFAQSGATVTMSGGTIEGNKATSNFNGSNSGGGGIYIDTGSTSLLMSGGTIKNNVSNNGTGGQKGKGLVIASGSTFSISGTAEIDENNDVALNSGARITVKDVLSPASGVTAKILTATTPTFYNAEPVLVKDSSITDEIFSDACSKFTSDTVGAKITSGGINNASGAKPGYACIPVASRTQGGNQMYYAKLSEAIADADASATQNSPDLITIVQDFSMSENIRINNSTHIAISAPSNKDVTIKRITTGGDSPFFQVNGSLTLKDSGKKLIIDGNKESGVVGTGFHLNGGSVIMQDNVVVQNFKRASASGSGFYIMSGGTLNMSGSATISIDNDVYLPPSLEALVLSGTLTPTGGIAARITPSDYTTSTALGGDFSTDSNYGKFIVTHDSSNPTNFWSLNASGKLESTSSPNYMASGGTANIVIIDNVIYEMHEFTTVGSPTLAITRAPIAAGQVLIVGGGGSGGSASSNSAFAGGGGAGGVIYNEHFPFTVTTYNLVVGAGGSSVAIHYPGNNGGNSSFATFTAFGGGCGGRGASAGDAGASGGSGGGGGGGGAGGSSTQSGTEGGHGNDGSSGGGGGGAGAPGSGENGGIGFLCNITGADVYYGGGGGTYGSTPGLGTIGGGGTGGVNTGFAMTETGTAGGNGIVITRWVWRPY